MEEILTKDAYSVYKKLRERAAVALLNIDLKELLESAANLIEIILPRTYRKEEILRFGSSENGSPVCWLEVNGDPELYKIITMKTDDAELIVVTKEFVKLKWDLNNYECTWRCWCGKPSVEQRNDTLWIKPKTTMNLRDKLIEGLKCWCVEKDSPATRKECKEIGCPYAESFDCDEDIMKDAYQLLTEGRDDIE